jgi:hypothetical protein
MELKKLKGLKELKIIMYLSIAWGLNPRLLNFDDSFIPKPQTLNSSTPSTLNQKP